MKHYLRKLVISWLLRDFTVSSKTLSLGERAQAMVDLSSPSIRTYQGILIANLIRRHLTIKDMNEGAWYLGAIAILRKQRSESEEYMKNMEQENNLTSDRDSVQV